jgi:hypothetical protein
MYVRGILASIAFAVLAVSLTGCGLFSLGGGLTKSTPGSAAVIGIDNYDGSESCPSIAPYPSQAALSSASALQSDGWSTVSLTDPSSMSNSTLTSYMTKNALFYFGHGDTGVVVFPTACSALENGSGPASTQYWGIGNLGGFFPKDTGSLPGGANLYWMFLFSSDTVAPDANQDPTDASSLEAEPFVANEWDPLFYQANLPLRAMFGYWQSLGSCPDPNSAANGTRNCDVLANNNPGVASTLLSAIAAGSTASNIADAWQQANSSNNESGAWSYEIDSGAQGDNFSTAGLATRSGIENFNYAQSASSPSPFISVPGTPGTISTEFLVNESLNVSGAVSTGDTAYSAGSYTTASNGSTTEYTSTGGLQVNYYQGLSGGVTYHGMTLHNIMGISESAAEAGAVSFIDNSFGMPSDAALVDVLSLYTRESNGSVLLTGYEFIWNHASGTMFGGDAIKVDVEDYHYLASQVCDKTVPLSSVDPKPICIQWTYTYADKPNISYGYRLWRSTQERSLPTSSGFASGGPAVDAYTASLALPDSNAITGYVLGYWTTGLSQASGLAEPAWIFTTGSGRIYAVDAGSGAVIGTETQ